MAVRVDGTSLTSADVDGVARGSVTVEMTEAALTRARRAWEVVKELVDERPVYGRTTGVGANHQTSPGEEDDGVGHGRRLLRSHAGGAGPVVPAEVARAMLLVRLNQLAVGGSGVDPRLLGVLTDAVNRGLTPRIHAYGAIGTGDLNALATTALCVLGERAWDGGELPAYPLDSSDALAFLSSNAATLGESALVCVDLNRLLGAALTVATLSFLAVDGCPEAYAAVVQNTRPHPGQRGVAARIRALLGPEEDRPRARIQDPFAFRVLPQVHGPAVDAAEHLERVLTTELNAAAENPLVGVESRDVFHNGNFHTAYVSLALDAARAALFQTAAPSAARLGALFDPGITGLRAFLAAGPESSSGAMILEYTAHSALADMRQAGTPASLGTAVLSRGVEEHASFSTEAARSTGEAVRAYEVVLACELVAAVRALRMRGITPASGPLREAYDRAADVLDHRTEDRALDGDLQAAIEVLPNLGRV